MISYIYIFLFIAHNTNKSTQKSITHQDSPILPLCCSSSSSCLAMCTCLSALCCAVLQEYAEGAQFRRQLRGGVASDDEADGEGSDAGSAAGDEYMDVVVEELIDVKEEVIAGPSAAAAGGGSH